MVALGEIAQGTRAVVEGEVLLTEVAFRGRRQMLSRIADGSGFLTLRFFHFTAGQREGLARGVRIRCFGEVRRGPAGLEMVHPEYRRADAAAAAGADEHLTPIYPATEGLTQGRLRQLVGAGARADGRRGSGGLAARRAPRGLAAAGIAGGLAIRPSSSRRRARRSAFRPAPPGAAAARVRGAPRASAVPEAAAPAYPARARLAARGRRRAQGTAPRVAAVSADARPSARARGNRGGSCTRQADAAPRARRCRLRQDAGGGARRDARHRRRDTRSH